jgi:hypothetical protein
MKFSTALKRRARSCLDGPRRINFHASRHAQQRARNLQLGSSFLDKHNEAGRFVFSSIGLKFNKPICRSRVCDEQRDYQPFIAHSRAFAFANFPEGMHHIA